MLTYRLNIFIGLIILNMRLSSIHFDSTSLMQNPQARSFAALPRRHRRNNKIIFMQLFIWLAIAPCGVEKHKISFSQIMRANKMNTRGVPLCYATSTYAESALHMKWCTTHTYTWNETIWMKHFVWRRCFSTCLLCAKPR